MVVQAKISSITDIAQAKLLQMRNFWQTCEKLLGAGAPLLIRMLSEKQKSFTLPH